MRPVAQGRERSGAQERREIGSLLFVGGPSSVGKSSFIRQLQAHALPAEIQDRLPKDTGKWKRVEEKNYEAVFGGDIRSTPASYPKVIFHYDTMDIYDQGCDGYENDRQLDVLFMAQEVFIVDIRASARTLERNMANRSARARPKRGHERLLKYIKRRIRGYGPKPAREHAFPRLEAYRDELWLEQFYYRWEKFLAKATDRLVGPAVVIRVEASSRPAAEPTFRLLGPCA